MVTFKRVENADRVSAETYLGETFAPECNVYAAVDGGLVGAGALGLQGAAVRIVAVRARPEYFEFTLRSLVYVASITGLPVEGDLPALTRYGFTQCGDVFRAKAQDIVFPSQCRHG